jgi:hypothetical protein
MDEVEYTDPAANLYFGQGFTSTMWAQDRHEFWCGNVPLYQGILYVAFKVFGFGLLQARMTSGVLAASGAVLVWAALRRSRLVTAPRNRLLALALILSGSVSNQTFRMIRYDSAMFFICALVFFGCTLPSRWRCLAVLVFSPLLPFAGVPMLPYLVFLATIYLLVYRLANIGLLVSLGAGFALGIGALVAFYRHFGVWQRFVDIVLPFTAAGHGQTRSMKDIIFGDSLGDENLLTSFFGNPVRFLDPKTLFDYSAFLLFLVAALIAFKTWRAAGGQSRKLMLFILATTLLVPPLMHAAGHYRSYYRWMTYVPLAMVVPRLLEIARESGCSLPVRRWAFAAISFSLLLGVPLRTLAVIPGWKARSMKPLDEAAAAMVKPSDIVVCQHKAYFAIRPRAQLVFALGLPARGEFGLIKDLPTNDLSLLCIFPEDLPKILPTIGGNWKKLDLANGPDARALARSRYAVDFYRRETK